MSQNTPDQSAVQRLAQKMPRFRIGRRPKASSPLKQRMEEVLKGDRQSIQDPLTQLQSLYSLH